MSVQSQLLLCYISCLLKKSLSSRVLTGMVTINLYVRFIRIYAKSRARSKLEKNIQYNSYYNLQALIKSNP